MESEFESKFTGFRGYIFLCTMLSWFQLNIQHKWNHYEIGIISRLCTWRTINSGEESGWEVLEEVEFELDFEGITLAGFDIL